MLKAFVVYVRPLIEYSTQIWSPHTVQLITLIEDVQRSSTRRLPGLTDLSYEVHWNLIITLILGSIGNQCYNRIVL